MNLTRTYELRDFEGGKATIPWWWGVSHYAKETLDVTIAPLPIAFAIRIRMWLAVRWARLKFLAPDVVPLSYHSRAIRREYEKGLDRGKEVGFSKGWDACIEHMYKLVDGSDNA